MNSAGKNYQIIESTDWDRAVAAIGTHTIVDAVLFSIVYALHRNPKGFPILHQPNVHFAKTKIRITGRNYIPSYRMWFRVIDAQAEVHLLWIEVAPPEEMGYGDIFSPEDDDIPF